MNLLDFNLTSALPAAPFREEGLQDPRTWPASWSQIETKLTNCLDSVTLPRHDVAGVLSGCLAGRASRRDGGEQSWDVDRLGALLSNAVGVRTDRPDRLGDRRAYPSAGGRFPVEIYLAADGLSDLANVFHYSVLDHELHGVRRFDDLPALLKAAFGTEWVAASYGVVVLTAVIERSARKYGDRAYRYGLLESGHLAQNLLLTAEAMGTGTTPVGGFADRVVTAMVGADGQQEVVTYAVVLT